MNFSEILQQFNIPTAPEGHHHARPGWIQFDCPFCGKHSNKYHMGYNISNGYVNCWRCGTHNLIETLMELLNLSFVKCKKLISQIDYIRIKETKVKGRLIIPKGVGDLLPKHKEYLEGRELDCSELTRLWKIQGIGIASRLAWRIFIPIYYQNQIVSWTTRSISPNAQLRYISASKKEELINHKDLLYGEDYAKHTIIICEGVFDVWSIGEGAVATLGTGYSKAQINRMLKYPKRCVCFDNEKEAQQRAKKLCNQLSCFSGTTKNIILEAKDAAESKPKEIRKLKKLLGSI